MQNWKNIVRVMICLGLICTLCSCRTAAGRSTGQVIDDMNLTAVIKTRIFNDPYLSGFAVSVDAFQGEVTLTGAVESEFAKKRASELAETVDGVRKVNNLLAVR
jgi:hyperosmotically inducible periplasmic protein